MNPRKAVDPGCMTELILFESQPAEVQDLTGAVSDDDWAEDFREYANYQPLGSREFHTEWKQIQETTGRFLIRARTDINTQSQRINWNGRYLRITGTYQHDEFNDFTFVEVISQS